MSVNKLLILILLCNTVLVSFCTVYASVDFSRYQTILDRKPFGEAPPPPAPAPPKPIPASQSFARSLRLCALIEEDDGSIQVGLQDIKNKTSFYLSVGDIEEGIELISADYELENAVLQKGSEMAIVNFGSGDIQPLTQQEAKVRLTNRKTGYAARRRMREEARKARLEKAKEDAKKPKLTGAELEQHLQEYQMEVIRQGLPPLPIPLSAEMDAQLVEEGILPPAN